MQRQGLPPLHCRRTAHHRQRTAATATAALPALPATLLLPKTPRYRHAPQHCQAGHHCHAAATAATNTASAALLPPLPLPPPHCHCTATAIAALPLFFPCCHRHRCPATLLPAAAVLQLPLPQPLPGCCRQPCAANAAATLPAFAALLLRPLHCRCVAVAPSIAIAVVLPSRCPLPPSLVDCCFLPQRVLLP